MHISTHRKDGVLWLYRLSFCMPNFESSDPFETGSDSRLAINKFIDAFSSSIYNDSISLSTNFGISLRFLSISPTRCIRPSSSRRMAAACSSAESNYIKHEQEMSWGLSHAGHKKLNQKQFSNRLPLAHWIKSDVRIFSRLRFAETYHIVDPLIKLIHYLGAAAFATVVLNHRRRFLWECNRISPSMMSTPFLYWGRQFQAKTLGNANEN